MKIYKSTIQLLRIPFSINLLPIFLFAVYNAFDSLLLIPCLLILFIIHLVFYPASNAYNSYMDDDEGSIAGLRNPMKPTRQLYHASILLDIIGLLLSLLISLPFTLINLLLVVLSRLYSYRKVRLKKYPIVGFLMVAFSQGSLSYINMKSGIQKISSVSEIFSIDNILESMVACLFVAAIYPITQIYQHQEDAENGDITISMLLGYRGTFIVSGIFFVLSNILIAALVTRSELLIFEAFMALPVGFFIYWFWITWKDVSNANFKNTMTMALSAAICMNISFSIILLLKII